MGSAPAPRVGTPTEIFVAEVYDQLHTAIHFGGRRGRAIARELADHLKARRVAAITSQIAPDQIELTDKQWDRLARNVRIQASFAAESW